MKSLLTLLLIGLSFFMQAQTVKPFPILKGEYLGQKPPKTIPEVFAQEIISNIVWAEHYLAQLNAVKKCSNLRIF